MQFETTTTLLPHQTEAAIKLAPARVNALFAEMGTGKSRIAIELAAARRRNIDRVVWFCPVSLRQTIFEEILKHTDATPGDICVFNDDTTDASLPMDRQWYVVGIESIASSNRVVLAVRKLMSERVYVVVDESTYIKNDRAKRSQRITHMSRVARYRSILTGTPITQSIADLYAQMSFLSPEILGYRSWYSFAANHLVQDPETGRILSTHDHDYLARRMAPYVHQVLKDECLQLPEKVHDVRWIGMTNSQRDMYENAKDWIYERYKDREDAGAGLLHLFTILQTIVQGFWTRPISDDRRDGTETLFCTTQRPGMLIEMLPAFESETHIVLWSNFKHGLREATLALQGEGMGRGLFEYTGDFHPDCRDENLAGWRREGGILLATQQSGGHGLTLVESATSIFYGNGYKYGDRIQAEDRTHRIGQTRKSLYVDIVCANSIDVMVHDALRAKANALKRFRKAIDDVRRLGMGAEVRDFIARM